MVDEWNKEDEVLRVGDEVTIDGEIYIIGNQRPTGNKYSYWVVVNSLSAMDGRDRPLKN